MLLGYMGSTRKVFLCLSCLVGIHFVLLTFSAINNSPTTDEVTFLSSGISHWYLGRFELCAVNPPLVRMVAAIPVMALNPNVDWSNANVNPAIRSDLAVGRQFIQINANNVTTFFSLARMACIPFSILGMCVCFLWARGIYGIRAGLFVAFLWSFSPMVLGHGSLITADVGAAAFGVAALYRFRIWLLTSSLSNALVLGVVTGFALLTKFVFVPTFPVIALLVLPLWRGRDWLKFRGIGRDFVHVGVAVLVSFLVINLVYDFEGSFTPLGDIKFSNKLLRANVEVGRQPEGSQQSQPEDRLTYVQNRFSGTLLGRVPILLPLLYVQGIDLVGIEVNLEGSGARSYLMGQWKDGGWWYYYIIGVLTKEPLAILILGFIAMGAYVCRTTYLFRFTSANVPFRELAMIAIPAVVIFVFVSMQTGFNRHLRYTLPAYPFGYILVSSVVQFLDDKKIVVFASMLVASSMFAFPHWLSYYNEAAGGPKNGSYWLLGSNTDWSQDLLRLKGWMKDHPDAGPMKSKLYCSRYSPSALGIHTETAPPFVPGRPGVRDKDGNRGPLPGWYAVSLRVLKETVIRHDSGYQYFERFTPVDQAGYTILIYHISPAEAAEVTKSLELEEQRSVYLWSSRE